jgi:dihydroflavonol-4-reductase
MILVTGATGHIGNVLVRQLIKNGEKVRALIWQGEDTSPLEGLEIEKFEGDVLEIKSLKSAFQGIEMVYHLAGVISIMPGRQPRVWRVNVEGTRNVIRAAKQAGIKRLIYTSSIHAIKRIETGLIDESLPYDVNNPYGAYDNSKAQASLDVQHAAHDGLDAVIVCPTGVIGPYDFRRSEMGQVILDAVNQKPSPYIDGAYDFVDVRDVASGLMLAAEKGRQGESYILSGTHISVRYLLETIQEITGKGFFRFKLPRQFAELCAKFTPLYYSLTKSKPRFTPYSLEVLKSNSHISHAKATTDLGYHTRPFYESLKDTVLWFLDNRSFLVKV